MNNEAANGMIIWFTRSATAAVIVRHARIVEWAPYLFQRVKDAGWDGRTFWARERCQPGVTLCWVHDPGDAPPKTPDSLES